MRFNGKLLIIGCGGVSQCAIPLALRHIEMPPEKITIMDFLDMRHRIKDPLARGVKYVQFRITKDNYKTELAKYVGRGDMIIDLAWDIDTCAVLQWCHENEVLYINTSIELWAPYHGAEGKHPTELTLYARHMRLRKMIASWGSEPSPTAVFDHGANPGLVSHFTKQALLDIGAKILTEKPKDSRRVKMEKAMANGDFPQLAMLEGVKVIHISERDTQITNVPKEVNEFVNTWSILGFYEEAVAPSELGWGTHEKYIPKGAMFHTEGPKNQICLTSKGMNTKVRSWVPCGDIIGFVIRHGEAFSISDKLTVWSGNTAIYRPTVHYAYRPADVAVNSLIELEMRQFEMQPKLRILSDDITSGRDELGCLLMGHDFNSWWIGSLLDIEETRKLVPGQNATTLQVAISVIAAAQWMIENPKKGVCVPDDLPHDQILKLSKPYLGPFISKPVDWTPLKSRKNHYLDYGTRPPKEEDVWQFTSFLVSQQGAEAPRAAQVALEPANA